MNPANSQTREAVSPIGPDAIRRQVRRVERRQWGLWASAALVTLLLMVGVLSFTFPISAEETNSFYAFYLSQAVRGLVALVLMFDIYATYQQLQIQRIRREIIKGEELFRLITENAADMIAVVDAKGQRLYNSPAYQRVLGYSPEELGRTSAFEQIHPDDRQRVVDAAKEAHQTGVGRRLEYRIRHKDGTWRSLESTASAARNARGEIEKLVIVNRDISERKQLELQLYQSQKLEAVGQLSGGIAHDFNNLLGVIIGYSEVFREQLPAKDPIREAMEEIYKAGQRAAGLTRQLLAFSRLQVLEPKVLDLNVVVAEVEKMLRRLIGEDIELTAVLAPNLGRVKADRGQLEQVIMNLVVNSRDAMPHGGKLIIETANAELTEADVHRYPYAIIPGPYVMLSVTDTGCGMNPETQARIFEPFFTTKEKGKGTGLGLSMVYGVIKQSGGYIWVDSEPEKGTRFRIYVPQVEASVEPVPELKVASGRPAGPRTVLLVEDEQSLRQLTRKFLRDEGYTVLEAANSLQAIEIAKAQGDGIDLLLTDVVMPGMSGPALATELASLRPETKVLYMSGYTDRAIAVHGVLELRAAMLHKPFTRGELIRKVDEVLAPEKAS